MNSAPDSTPQRTRECLSRVRTGCNTCKARRVKCDEARPVCRRCAIRDRPCEYNSAPVARRRKDVITVYLPAVQSQPAFFTSDPGVDFFRHHLAAKLDGQFDSTFWSRLVLQLAHGEPSIRHAVSAIGVTHQDVESSLQHPAGFVYANPGALKEWNAAVHSLSDRIRAQPSSRLVPLVCCLLFTCIEFLRGNIEPAMLHTESGLHILASLRHQGRADVAANEMSVIASDIVPMFTRLNLLCSLAGRLIPAIHVPVETEGSPPRDLADARRRLFAISDACVRFIHEASPKAAAFQMDVEDFVRQVKLQQQLEAWRSELDDLARQMQAAGKPTRQDAFHLLLVHYKVMYIWTRSCTTAGEMASDSYYADFGELVSFAERAVPFHGAGVDTQPPPLSFDIQILGPLYYAALKCRHPALRRRALELLPLAPRREGLWNAHYAYVTAQRVIALEESCLNEHGWPDETVRVHGLPLPDDESRMSPSYTRLDSRQSYSVVMSPTYPATLEVVFQTKPWGLLGEWKNVTEYIKL